MLLWREDKRERAAQLPVVNIRSSSWEADMEKVVQACSRVSAAVMTAERGARPAEVIFYLLIYGWNKSTQSTSDYLTEHLPLAHICSVASSLYGGPCIQVVSVM